MFLSLICIFNEETNILTFIHAVLLIKDMYILESKLFEKE